ncbi:MAG: hypothetical protein WBV67_01865 [Candidatus Cybelea sp.]|jgi:hypothetical protein
MQSDVLGARDSGLTPGFGYGRTKLIASHGAVDEMWGAAGGTIYIPTASGVAEAIYAEISTAAIATGTVRIGGAGSAALLQSVGSNLFVITGAQDNASVRQVRFEALGPRERSGRRFRDEPCQVRASPKA